MSTDNKDEIILEGSEEQSIEAKRNKIAVKDNHPNHSGDNTNNQDQSM